MALRYCFEQPYITRTLSASKRSDLAVVDTDGCEAVVKSAVSRVVLVYVYVNQKLTALSAQFKRTSNVWHLGYKQS